MSESKAIADRVAEIVPGVWWWAVHDERINFIGVGYAVSSDDGAVLIDPHSLAEEPLRTIGEVSAICLTTSSHQRCSWRLRRELGVQVWAPAASKEVEEEPDVRYSEGDELPGGLRPVFTPGAGTTQHTLLLERNGGVAFVPDLFVQPPGADLSLIPEQYAHDLDEAKRSVEKLLDLQFAVLCPGHGAPIADDPKAAMRQALGQRTEHPSDASDWES